MHFLACFSSLWSIFSRFSVIFTDFWPLGTSKKVVFAWEVLHFSEKSLLLFFSPKISRFFEFSLFLVDLGDFWLHFGPQKTLLGRPGAPESTGLDPPFSHVVSLGPPGVDLGASGGGF